MLKKITRSIAILLAFLICFSAFTSCAEIVDEINNILSSESKADTETNLVSSQDESADSSQAIIVDSNDSVTNSESDLSNASETTETESFDQSASVIEEDGVYTTAEDVALYIHTYNKLPNNFITKNEARALGWEGGSVEKFAPGKCIGGDRFGNYEGSLPTKKGRVYTECDIDTLGASSRGAKRIVFSNDGLVYYTDDHYETFTLLYGEE